MRREHWTILSVRPKYTVYVHVCTCRIGHEYQSDQTVEKYKMADGIHARIQKIFLGEGGGPTDI